MPKSHPESNDAKRSAIEKKAQEINAVIDGIGFGRFQVIVIILCGLIQACSTMQIQYATFVGQQLQCVWRINDFWKSCMTSATFIGMLAGAYLWGPLGDKLCRRSVDGICMGCIVFYGCLTSLAPNIIWMVVLRFLVGVGVGGAQPLTESLLGEFMTTHQRGPAWFAYQTLWCFGSLSEIGMAWVLLALPQGWCYLAVVTALPLLLLTFPWLLWLPVSPRQTLLQGRIEETRQALNKITDTNSQPRYHGDFSVSDWQPTEVRGSVIELFRQQQFLRMSLQLAVIAFAAGFNYYGTVLLNVQVPLLLQEQCAAPSNTTKISIIYVKALSERTCYKCDPIRYFELLIPTLADLATAILNAFFIERSFGRRLTMTVAFSAASVLIPLLAFCMHSAVRIALFFAIRFAITSGYQTIWLYVLEAYPTSLRSTASAFLSSFSRIASVLMPFVAQMFIIRVSLLGGLFIFSGIVALAAVSAALLPIETKDRPLEQMAHHEEVAAKHSGEDLPVKTKIHETIPLQSDYGSVESSIKTK